MMQKYEVHGSKRRILWVVVGLLINLVTQIPVYQWFSNCVLCNRASGERSNLSYDMR